MKLLKELYEILNRLGIEYEEIRHEPVYTVKEAESASAVLCGTGCKALFLKSKSDYYLLLLEENKRTDMKKLTSLTGVSGLSFANAEKLEEILGLQPGSVTAWNNK